MNREDVVKHYREHRQEIENRLDEFRDLRDADEERLFQELVFVILTSQTQARNAWQATLSLSETRLLYEGEEEDIAEVLAAHEVQYERNKAGYIVENREDLSQPTLKDPSGKLKISGKIKADRLEQTREWLVNDMNGLGWKGGSHFLRNIGHGNGFAIISSRISSKMYELGLMESPKTPDDREEYMETERKLSEFSQDTEIDIKAMDLVLWSMETGEVFK